MQNLNSKEKSLAVIAGGGILPRLVIESCNLPIDKKIIICVNNSEKYEWVENFKSYKADMWEIEKIFAILESNKISRIIFAGHVKRPNFTELKLDILAIKLMAKIAKNKIKGDNNILSSVIKFAEERGYEILAPNDIIKSIQVDEGLIGNISYKNSYDLDIEIGKSLLEKLSEYDIGQSLIINDRRIIAIEAVEGTDSMLMRAIELKNKGGILLKFKKQGQNIRVDLPVIGINTIKLAHEAGLEGIIIGANSVLILEKPQLIELADKLKIFIKAI